MWVCLMFILLLITLLISQLWENVKFKMLKQLWKHWTSKRASALQDRQPTTTTNVPTTCFLRKSRQRNYLEFDPFHGECLLKLPTRFAITTLGSSPRWVEKRKQKEDRRYYQGTREIITFLSTIQARRKCLRSTWRLLDSKKI